MTVGGLSVPLKDQWVAKVTEDTQKKERKKKIVDTDLRGTWRTTRPAGFVGGRRRRPLLAPPGDSQ